MSLFCSFWRKGWIKSSAYRSNEGECNEAKRKVSCWISMKVSKAAAGSFTCNEESRGDTCGDQTWGIRKKLSDFIEPFNQTSFSKKCHYFVHFWEKAGLKHQPIDQMKGNVMRPRGKFLVESQWKFQKQLQEVLLVMRNQEEILVMAKHEASDNKSDS